MIVFCSAAQPPKFPRASPAQCAGGSVISALQ
jgi:hypothetical protein